jgi:hypothetical protein
MMDLLRHPEEAVPGVDLRHALGDAFTGVGVNVGVGECGDEAAKGVVEILPVGEVQLLARPRLTGQGGGLGWLHVDVTPLSA